MRKRSGFFLLLVFLFLSTTLHAQRLMSMEFHNQPITDILMALAAATGTSIIPDETVNGTASFYFSESDFEEALGLFLSTYHLAYVREGNVFRVSRISVSYNREDNLVTMKGDSVEIESLVRALSKSIEKTILYDPFPSMKMSVAMDRLSPDKALEIITRKLGEYALETNESFFYIKRLPSELQGKRGSANSGVTRTGDNYSLSVEKARFIELLADLFRKAGKEYSLMVKSDAVLENLYFSDRDFEALLRLVLEQGNADFIIRDGVYYILELQRRDVVKKLKDTSMITLSHLSAQDLPGLLPAELAAGNMMKVDKNSNTVYLTGSDEEKKPVLDFIALVDRPSSDMTYKRFEIKYLKVKDLLTIIPPKLTPIPPFVIPESNAFIVSGTKEGLKALEEYIETVDRKSEGYPVHLRYIKTEEIMKNLPPSITKEDVIDSGYPNLFFFVGSEDKRKLFLRELASIDRPKPQIRYELLVIQYQKKNTLTFDPTMGNDMGQPGKTFAAGLANIFSLSFDVVSKFGYQFATKLSLALSENLAQVYADTTLNGLSGQEIKFQNTETTRTPTLEVNESTGAITNTGAVKEITSGLIISLNGWVSGDNMITINVNATVSKEDSSETQSITNSSNTGSTVISYPSTSERIVTTQVRTPSGKPIIIGGLITEDVHQTTKKFPLLGDIPLLGLLFRTIDKTRVKSEIVIYIVPHLGYDGDDSDIGDCLERYYASFIKGNR